MTTDVDIGNMALSRLGTRATIADLTENSTEARVVNTWYATVRDDLLSMIDWNFSRLYLALSQSGTPPDRWSYSYAYPSDCLKFRRLDLGLPVGLPGDPQAAFEVGSDGSNRFIWCNLSEAVGVYSARVTDPSRFEPAFVRAFVDCLAAPIAYPITQKSEIANLMERKAQVAIENAMASSANEQSGQGTIPDAESLTVRGYDWPTLTWVNWSG